MQSSSAGHACKIVPVASGEGGRAPLLSKCCQSPASGITREGGKEAAAFTKLRMLFISVLGKKKKKIQRTSLQTCP